mgnify:CR=1 FL=1
MIMDEVHAYDTAFGNAVHRAVADPNDFAKPGDASTLIEWLRSEAPMGKGERELLADLLAELAARKPKRSANGRPKGSKLRATEQWRMVVAYRELVANGEAPKNALVDTAKAYGVSTRTLQSAMKEIAETERRIQNQGREGWTIAALVEPPSGT